HLSGLEERRDLELEVHAEQRMLPHARAQLALAHRAVEVDEAMRPVAAQAAVAAERAQLPPRRLLVATRVVEERVQREDRVVRLPERDEVAPVAAELDEGRVAPE